MIVDRKVQGRPTLRIDSAASSGGRLGQVGPFERFAYLHVAYDLFLSNRNYPVSRINTQNF
jgi:hypothetical protein